VLAIGASQQIRRVSKEIKLIGTQVEGYRGSERNLGSRARRGPASLLRKERGRKGCAPVKKK